MLLFWSATAAPYMSPRLFWSATAAFICHPLQSVVLWPAIMYYSLQNISNAIPIPRNTLATVGGETSLILANICEYQHVCWCMLVNSELTFENTAQRAVKKILLLAHTAGKANKGKKGIRQAYKLGFCIWECQNISFQHCHQHDSSQHLYQALPVQQGT